MSTIGELRQEFGYLMRASDPETREFIQGLEDQIASVAAQSAQPDFSAAKSVLEELCTRAALCQNPDRLQRYQEYLALLI